MSAPSGEIQVTASSGGRRMTLEPLRVIPVTVEFRQVENLIPCGFQMEWMEDREAGVSMACGAGLGSRWLTVEMGDKRFCLDGNALLNALHAAVEDLP